MYLLARITGWLLSLAYLIPWRLSGWRITGQAPDLDKYVIIGAPHTSSWDYLMALAFMAGTRRRPAVFVKIEAMSGLLGVFFRLMGSISIDRSQSHNFVEQVVQVFNERDRLLIALAPEGTRKKTGYWRTGFYHIALGAGVPVLMIGTDYKRKRLRLGPVLHPTGDIESDFEIIREFYTSDEVNPKYPEKMGEVRLRPKDDAD